MMLPDIIQESTMPKWRYIKNYIKSSPFPAFFGKSCFSEVTLLLQTYSGNRSIDDPNVHEAHILSRNDPVFKSLLPGSDDELNDDEEKIGPYIR